MTYLAAVCRTRSQLGLLGYDQVRFDTVGRGFYLRRSKLQRYLNIGSIDLSVPLALSLSLFCFLFFLSLYIYIYTYKHIYIYVCCPIYIYICWRVAFQVPILKGSYFGDF